MLHCDALIAPRWCVPIEPADAVLTEHALIVTDGKISDLLPTVEARAKYLPSVLVERPQHVLLPGLVNTHTHAAMTLFRGLADDMPLEAWLREGIWPAEKRWVSAEMVRDGTQLAIAEMLAAGITCFSDQYFFPEIVAETAVEHHMRAVVGTPIVEFKTGWADDAAECLSKGADLVHDAYANHPLITSCFAPHATYSLSDESFTSLRVLADQLDVGIQIHLHETAAEIENAICDTGMRPLQRLMNLGLVNASLLVVHGVHLNAVEISQLAAAGVCVAHCPKSNLKLASGIAPIVAMRSAGINVAIGTDGAASNNVLDMLSETRAAALLAKVQASDASAISAREALRMATLGGAIALGLGAEIGSLVPGKWADLTCVDLSQNHSQPVYDPVSQLVYTARADQVSDVWVAGRHRLEDDRLNGMDNNAIRARCEEWRERIAATARPLVGAQS